MCKTDIEFSKNTLFINTYGILNKKNIRALKRKLSYIIGEYNISEIVLNTINNTDINEKELYKFLDEYNRNRGANLTLIN